MLLMRRSFSTSVFRDSCVELLMLMLWLLFDAHLLTANSNYRSRLITFPTSYSFARLLSSSSQQTRSYLCARNRCAANYYYIYFICMFNLVFCLLSSSISALSALLSTSRSLSTAEYTSLGDFLLKCVSAVCCCRHILRSRMH
jgi:hypothetical protein